MTEMSADPHSSAVADQEPQIPRLVEGLKSSSHWPSSAIHTKVHTETTQLPTEGKVYPPNSRRLTVKHLKLLAEALELPTSSSGDGQWNEWMPDELLLQLAGHLRRRVLQEWNLMSRTEKS